ncbi:hemolysin BL lytic component L1 [Bacillus thuringiensis serovar silo]|uniref:HBL/NHE enterotoxin family protein n=1 Tax=Bacillus thuringiensis TaxID=1428 RepID=UPI000A35E26F|nr:HBL/NHE enterotoxin family protein [Bacillus thuringiensis]MED3272489.1 HBL/NHE enterotoxin family protein [Bacillus thuringiensis]OTW54725.1 hemolysin BL lytic component L1 [Bacillus thuringiensis serovar silo]OTW62302.1 hemolysin BL lytic component L1 [Bacillus thuringiensis serovar toguchini]
MKKIPYKVLTLATLATIVTTSNILPIRAFAAEQVVQQTTNQDDTYKLGPEGLEQALADTGSNMIVMNLYAKTINAQPDVDLSGMPLGEGGQTLTKQIHKDQGIARTNANYWLNTAKPKIQDVTRDIINYNTQFQNYYTSLVDAVKKEDKATLKEGLGDLLDTLTKNSKDVEEVVSMLKQFKEKLYTDSTQLKRDVDGTDGTVGLTSILAGEDALIPELKKEIESLRKTQQEHLDNVLGWGIGGGLGTVILLGGAIAGTVIVVVTGGTATPLVVGALGTLAAAGIGLGTASGIMLEKNLKSYDQISKKIGTLSEQADQAQKAIISLTAAKSDVTALYQTVDKAIDALTGIKKQWDTMAANYQILLEDVDNMQFQKMSLIIDDLKSAKMEWNDIYKNAELIAKDLPPVK